MEEVIACKCAKCGGTSFATDQFQSTNCVFLKDIDMEHKKAVTVTCNQCGHEVIQNPIMILLHDKLIYLIF